MPELPEVETIRAGLAPYVVGKTIAHIELLHPRVMRKNLPDSTLLGQQIQSVARRGKFMWLELAEKAVVIHLGMSGQLRIGKVPDRHLRARFTFTDNTELSFIDQRTFGYIQITDLVPTIDNWAGGYGSQRPAIPAAITHIARDFLDPQLDFSLLANLAMQKKMRIKNLLLEQKFISGVGNIYADEALWAAQLHGARLANTISQPELENLFQQAKEVMQRALAVGGTSFDELYVDVQGSSGYFARSLNAYGRSGKPCVRCGKILIKENFMGRSSTYCPHCQRREV